MPFLLPYQQRQSTEGKACELMQNEQKLVNYWINKAAMVMKTGHHTEMDL